jgi:hypothetical protein
MLSPQIKCTSTMFLISLSLSHKMTLMLFLLVKEGGNPNNLLTILHLCHGPTLCLWRCAFSPIVCNEEVFMLELDLTSGTGMFRYIPCAIDICLAIVHNHLSAVNHKNHLFFRNLQMSMVAFNMHSLMPERSEHISCQSLIF